MKVKGYKMLNLTIFEFLKLFKNKKNVIFLFLLIFLIMFCVYLEQNNNSQKDLNWQHQQHKEIEHLQTKIKKEKNKDLISVYNNKIQEKQTYINNDINPKELNQYSFMKKTLPFFLAISILLIMYSVQIINDEYKYNTIKYICASPTSGVKVIFSKYGAILWLLFLWLLFYFLVSYGIGGIVNGFSNIYSQGIYSYNSKSFVETSLIYFIKYYFSEFVFMSVIASIVILLITITKNSVVSIITVLFLMLFNQNILNYLQKFEFYKITLFNVLDLKKYMLTSDSLLDVTMYISISIVYIVILLLLSSFFLCRNTKL